MKKRHAIGTKKGWWSSMRYRSSLVFIATLLIITGCGRSDQFGAAAPVETAYPAPNTAAAVAPGVTSDSAYPAPPTSPPSQTDVTVFNNYPSGNLGVVIDPTSNAIIDVLPNSPAQAAGIQIGDIITQLDGQAVGDKFKDAKTRLGSKYRKQIKVEIERQGKKRTVTVKADSVLPPTVAPGQPTPTPILAPYIYL